MKWASQEKVFKHLRPTYLKFGDKYGRDYEKSIDNIITINVYTYGRWNKAQGGAQATSR